MFSEPGKIVTEEELERFEKVLAGSGPIPDNLKVRDMWSHFKHYDSQSWMMTMMKWGGVALGVLGVVLVAYMAVSRFCPRLVGKQVGFALVGQEVPKPAATVRVEINNRQGDTDGDDAGDHNNDGEGDVELSDMSGHSRERATSMSVKGVLTSPTFSRKLIRKMSRAERKAVCESADIIRSIEGFKMYNTESEEETEDTELDQERKKKVVAICRNCGKDASDCLCATGLVPEWRKNTCLVCLKREKYCECENGFEKPGEYFPWATGNNRVLLNKEATEGGSV